MKQASITYIKFDICRCLIKTVMLINQELPFKPFYRLEESKFEPARF